ncbi:MAG: hypothetical protein ACFFCW_35980 [Candidatus Hodarchaeota archaeon]
MGYFSGNFAVSALSRKQGDFSIVKTRLHFRTLPVIVKMKDATRIPGVISERFVITSFRNEAIEKAGLGVCLNRN